MNKNCFESYPRTKPSRLRRRQRREKIHNTPAEDETSQKIQPAVKEYLSESQASEESQEITAADYLTFDKLHTSADQTQIKFGDGIDALFENCSGPNANVGMDTLEMSSNTSNEQVDGHSYPQDQLVTDSVIEPAHALEPATVGDLRRMMEEFTTSFSFKL